MVAHISQFVNLTPHTIRIYSHEGGTFVEVPASGTVARVETVSTGAPEGSVSCASGSVPGSHLEHGGSSVWQCPVVFTVYGEVTGLPEEDVPVIVSGMVLEALHGSGRAAYAPDTGATCVRSEDGRILGVRRLIRAR
jgi:hypothetical protein